MKTQSPELRLASLADADQIARMSSELIEVGLGWSWTVQRVTRAIQCPDTTVLTAKAGLTVQGFAIMRFGQDEAHLNLLAVAPNSQCQSRETRGAVHDKFWIASTHPICVD